MYTHEVVQPLEDEHGCTIRFIGVQVRHRDDWAVRIDGEPAFDVGRNRDEDGNTVYRLTAERFRRKVEEAIPPEV